MSIPMTDPDAFDEPGPVGTATHDIVHELTIAAPAAAVYDALTTARGRHGWWEGTDDHELEAGQLARVTVAGDLIEVRVEVADRPEVVLWSCTEGPREWVGTSISFRIESRAAEDTPEVAAASGSASVVRFWHGGWQYEDGLLPRASFEWAMFLDRLRRHLETA